MQLRRFTFVADIALQQVHLLRRHIEDILAGIMDFQVILMHLFQLYGLDAYILADTMDLMNDIIAWLQISEAVDFLALGSTVMEAMLLHAINIPF